MPEWEGYYTLRETIPHLPAADNCSMIRWPFSLSMIAVASERSAHANVHILRSVAGRSAYVRVFQTVSGFSRYVCRSISRRRVILPHLTVREAYI